MVPYLASVKYADVDREQIAPESVAGQDTDDVEDLLKLCGPFGKLQHVLLSGVGLLFVLGTRGEASHRVAGRMRIQALPMIQSVVMEVVWAKEKP